MTYSANEGVIIEREVIVIFNLYNALAMDHSKRALAILNASAPPLFNLVSTRLNSSHTWLILSDILLGTCSI